VLVPGELLDRLRRSAAHRQARYRDWLNYTQPGMEASVSTAARMLIFRALEQVETEMGVRKPGKSIRALFRKQRK
jgi:hypothetical protein